METTQKSDFAFGTGLHLDGFYMLISVSPPLVPYFFWWRCSKGMNLEAMAVATLLGATTTEIPKASTTKNLWKRADRQVTAPTTLLTNMETMVAMVAMVASSTHFDQNATTDGYKRHQRSLSPASEQDTGERRVREEVHTLAYHRVTIRYLCVLVLP